MSGKIIKYFNTSSKILCIIFVLVGIVFAAIGLAFTGGFSEANKMQEILETGVDGVGYNVEMFSGGVTINNESYFYLTFNYVDADGVEKEGKTATTYTQAQAANLVMQNSIDIVYNGNGAIDKAFNKSNATRINKIMVGVFCGLGVIFLFVGGMHLMRKQSNVSVKQHGVETQGIVEKAVGGIRINNVEYFKIKVSYTNQRGEREVGSTTHDYTLEQTENYPAGKSVRIKYHGKNIIILDEEK